MSNGPYKIQEYTKGNQMVLVATRTGTQDGRRYRPAYPDKIVVKFGLDQSVIDQRIIRDSGEDQQAFMRESLLSADLATVFNDDARGPSRLGPVALRPVLLRQRREGAEPQAPPGPRRGARPGTAQADRRRQVRRRPR